MAKEHHEGARPFSQREGTTDMSQNLAQELEQQLVKSRTLLVMFSQLTSRLQSYRRVFRMSGRTLLSWTTCRQRSILLLGFPSATRSLRQQARS